MAKRDIIAIGGSAGSGAALRQIVADLPEGLKASIFIATHVPSESSGYLADALARISALPLMSAIDGQPIEQGRIYVAVPDRHMLIIDGTLRLGDGPRENLTRPAIDPLFRSAALSYGPRAVGVVLSGMLNDGASGLWAIKHCGGTALVQHPRDAESDEMPLAALEAVKADAVGKASELGRMIRDIAASDAGEIVPVPDSIALDVEIAGGARLGAETLSRIADPSALSCPECHGVLSEIRDGHPLRYRCQTGHAVTAEVLAHRTQQVEEAMRLALRVMEERVTLAARMASDARANGRPAVAELYEKRSEEYAAYAETLRRASLDALRLRRNGKPQNL